MAPSHHGLPHTVIPDHIITSLVVAMNGFRLSFHVPILSPVKPINLSLTWIPVDHIIHSLMTVTSKSNSHQIIIPDEISFSFYIEPKKGMIASTTANFTVGGYYFFPSVAAF